MRTLATSVAFTVLLAAFAASAQQPANAPPPAVLVQPAEMRTLAAQHEYIGRAVALDKVDLRARVQGFLGPRKFADGDPVKEGQVLFTIERDTYEAAVAQKTAARDSAAAGLVNADIQLKRASELLRTQAGTQATFDQRTAEQLQAKALLAEAEASLKDAQINLSYCEIRSPITGRVGKAVVSPGNLVDGASGVLVTVVSEQPMRVQFSVTQRELLEARKAGGEKTDAPPFEVRVRLADGSLLEEKGKLDFLDVVVDPKTDGQTVRALFANAKRELTDSQTLRVVLVQTNAPKSLVIQQQAVAIDQTGPYVFVVNPDNKVEQRRIKTTPGRDGLIGVAEGIKEGDKVIVQGQQRVRAGMVVAPQAAPAAVQTKN
jgi:membrane fusion protein (multidrug efflux system)